MASLSASALIKNDWRVEVFIDKYSKRDKFELVGGQKVELLYTDENRNILAGRKLDELSKLVFFDARGNKYKLSNIQKNKEFGGKGEGFGINIELREIDSLNKQLDEVKKTLKKSTVPLRVGKKIYEVTYCEKTAGTPKSDFHLYDINGKEVVWMSHKEGSKPKDFQQWGGMTEKEVPVFKHKESQEFIKIMQKMFPKGLPNATTIAKKIKDPTLKKYSVYGIKYGGPLGQQNVSLVLQGPLKLVKKGNAWEIDANHVHFNGEDITGGFEPVFMAIYKGDRSNFNVKGARFGISPLESRKITVLLP